MTTTEPSGQNAAATSLLGIFAGNMRATIVAATAAIVVIVSFIDAVVSLYHHTEPLVCKVSGFLPLCPQPVEQWSDEVGGTGGATFSPLACQDNEVLVGVFGRADRGPFVYSMGPVCAAVQFDWRRRLKSVSESTRNGEEIGSTQGDAFILKCPSKMFAVGYSFDSSVVGTNFGAHEYLVVPLRLRCAAVGDTSSNVVAMSSQPQSNASHKPFQCPSDSVAFGIKGKAGQFVDAISLGCRSVR